MGTGKEAMDEVCRCGHDKDEHEDLIETMPCRHRMDPKMGEIEDCRCREYEEWTEE